MTEVFRVAAPGAKWATLRRARWVLRAVRSLDSRACDVVSDSMTSAHVTESQLEVERAVDAVGMPPLHVGKETSVVPCPRFCTPKLIAHPRVGGPHHRYELHTTP